MMEENGQDGTYRHATQRTTGRVWQNRLYSCVLDDSPWETALRYVELNPVRARLAKSAEDHRWSTARAHLGLQAPPEWLDMDQFLRRWPTPASWRDSLPTLTRARHPPRFGPGLRRDWGGSEVLRKPLAPAAGGGSAFGER